MISNKIFHSYEEAAQEKILLEEAIGKEYYVDTGMCNGMSYYTIKNLVGKVSKKVGFIGVDLGEYIPA